MAIVRTILTLLAATAMAGAALAQTHAYQIGFDENDNPYALGHVLVGFVDSGNAPVVQVGSKMFGGIVDMYLSDFKVALILYPDGTNIFEKIEQISAYPGVRFAEPDYIRYTTFTPNDTSWGSQWGPQKINCQGAWDLEQGDPNVKIAICDTGIRYTHNDLNDDYVGGYDIYNGDSDPNDDNGHGTHCAGIASAETNNAYGIAGVGFNTSLLGVKVLGSGGSGSDSQVASGMSWARTNGAHVISLSLGSSSPSSTLQTAGQTCWNAGVVVCAAAGNNGSSSPFYPAYYTEYIAVGSTTSSDARSSFSNYGSWVDVAAPGSSIYSTYNSSNTSFTTLSGTSMACPHVAGAAGLLYSYLGGARSLANATTIRTALESTADYVGTWVAHGRINVGAAVASLSGPPTEYTYDAESAVVLVGTQTGGAVSSLHTDDNNFYQVDSATTFRYEIPGQPIRETKGVEYYAQFDVGAGTKTSGEVDISAFCTNPSTFRIQVYNFAQSRWEYLLISGSIGLTEQSYTYPLPGATSNYISSENKVRIKLITSSPVPHNLRTDLCRLRMMGL